MIPKQVLSQGRSGHKNGSNSEAFSPPFPFLMKGDSICALFPRIQPLTHIAKSFDFPVFYRLLNAHNFLADKQIIPKMLYIIHKKSQSRNLLLHSSKHLCYDVSMSSARYLEMVFCRFPFSPKGSHSRCFHSKLYPTMK